MRSGWPRGLLGAAGGAAGAIPLLPLARGFASRVFSLPRLPGAALKTGDIKEATYLEVAVLLVALPAAALFFGHVLPRLLETRAGFPQALAEWPGAAFGLSFVLWRSGAPAFYSLLGGLLFASLAAAGAPLLSSPERLRALIGPADRGALSQIFLAGALWELAWRSAQPGAKPALPDFPAGALLAGLLFALVALLLSRGRADNAA